MVGCPEVASGCCHYPPDREGLRSQVSVIRRSQQIVSYSEKILGDTVANVSVNGSHRGVNVSYSMFRLPTEQLGGTAVVGSEI